MFPFDFTPPNPESGSADQPATWPLQGCSAASRHFQQQLAERYQRGQLSLAQVHAKLAAATFQLVYRSQATSPPTPEQLQQLVQRARQANTAAHITGLLLYCDGQYIQVLEGPHEAVQRLFVRINHDPRHQQVVVVSQGHLPVPQFAGWRMAFGFADALEPEAVLAAIGQACARAELNLSSQQLQELLGSFVNPA